MNQVLPAVISDALPTAGLFAPVAADLKRTEAIFNRTLESGRPGVARLLEHLGPYRGKRLRPTLLLLAAQACGRIAPAHHVLGAVVEMVHTATLVHDDVLDSAAIRRHMPTLNATWGNQASILLGDYLFTHAFHLSSAIDDVRACRIIGDATNKVCEGELHQVAERGNLELTEATYFAIIEGKTAELTSCCCRLGAMYAGASREVTEKLADYGRNLGIAFQIADDLLDLVGDEDTTGKSLGTDLDQQKMTLPLVWLLQKRETANRVAQVLRAPGNHKRETLRPLLTEGGALAYTRRRAEEFAQRARTCLACLPPSECRSILEILTDRVVHRNT